MRRLLLAGVVVVAAGLAATVVPAFTGLIPASALRSLVGFLAVLGVIGGVTRRARADPETPDLPTLETVAIEPPGGQFDQQLRTAATRQTRRAGEDETEVRTRLRAAAVQTLMREGHSEPAATDQLRAGTWTDDPAASAFFLLGEDDEQPQTLPGETDATSRRSVRELFDDTAVFERRAGRVVAVLDERLAESATVGTDGASDPGRADATGGAFDHEQTESESEGEP